MLKVYEMTLDGTVNWFPAVSLKALKEEIRLLQEAPWRSIKGPVRYFHTHFSLCDSYWAALKLSNFSFMLLGAIY